MLDGTAAAYALLLGIVAAFNPCGFALLPAYITVLVTGSADEGVTRAMAIRRAVMFALAMTVGFMAIFTAFGVLFGVVSQGLQGSILPYVPYATIVIGAVLVVFGVILVRGGELRGPGLRLNTAAPRKSFWSQTVYGASFAVASLSCTIGLFLVIVTQALSATNPVAAVAPFLLYGIGMGTSILVVSLLAALAGSGVASALRRRTPMIMRIGGVLMIVAGVYVSVFGLSEVLPHHGVHVLDPVFNTTVAWQSSVIGAISNWNTAVLVGLAALAVITVVWVLVRGRKAKSDAVADTVAVPAGPSTPAAPAAPAQESSQVHTADPATLSLIKGSIRKPRDH